MNLPANDHHDGCGCYQRPHAMPDAAAYTPVYLPPQQVSGPYPPPQAYPVPQTDRAAQIAKYGGAAAVVVFTVMAVALFAVAIAISAVALTVCLLVLRALWREIQGGGPR